MTRFAALQMTSGTDVGHNLAQARELLESAVDRGAEVICLPEYFGYHGPSSQLPNDICISANEGLLPETLAEWAVEYGVWIIGGSLPIPIPRGRRFTNSTLVYNPDGKLVAQYDKIHLFNSFGHQESKIYRAGDQLVHFKLGDLRVGLSLCYDLRFPELYRGLALKGIDVFITPSAFTAETGKAHWDTLTRARAIENLAYVVAPAQITETPRTWGHSRIVDPWGRILAERPAGPGIVWADLRSDTIQEGRKKLPVLKNTRFSLKLKGVHK